MISDKTMGMLGQLASIVGVVIFLAALAGFVVFLWKAALVL